MSEHDMKRKLATIMVADIVGFSRVHYAGDFDPERIPSLPPSIRERGDVGGYRSAAGPVGSFKPNSWGLYDVLGNVNEPVQDCWNESYAGAPTDGSAWTAGDCTRHVGRGASWGAAAGWVIRVALRRPIGLTGKHNRVGIRVALSLP